MLNKYKLFYLMITLVYVNIDTGTYVFSFNSSLCKIFHIFSKIFKMKKYFSFARIIHKVIFVVMIIEVSIVKDVVLLVAALSSVNGSKNRDVFEWMNLCNQWLFNRPILSIAVSLSSFSIWWLSLSFSAQFFIALFFLFFFGTTVNF